MADLGKHRATTSGAAKPKSLAPKADPASASRQRIIEAAYQCFDRFGIRKTTVDDIASAAGVARPTFYTYFHGKEDVIDCVRRLEAGRINQEIRKRMTKYDNFADALTECLAITVAVARENIHVRALIEDLAVVSAAAKPHSERQRIHLERWSPLLTKAAARGELRPDLSIEEIVSWLTLAQPLLLTKVEADPLTKAQLRRFIRLFIVGPLLDPAASAG